VTCVYRTITTWARKDLKTFNALLQMPTAEGKFTSAKMFQSIRNILILSFIVYVAAVENTRPGAMFTFSDAV
jgi:hypothetical protein